MEVSFSIFRFRSAAVSSAISLASFPILPFKIDERCSWMELASGIGGAAPAAPAAAPAAPENASFINSVAFLNDSSIPSAPEEEAPVASAAFPNIDPISPMTSSSFVLSSLSSIASNNLAVSPKDPISERLFTMEKRIN